MSVDGEGDRPPAAEGLMRPLIGVTRAEILEYLAEWGIAYRVDSSNASPRFSRNRVRHDLIPTLAGEWNPEPRNSPLAAGGA